MVKWGCAIGALMVGALPMAAQAQDQPTPARRIPAEAPPSAGAVRTVPPVTTQPAVAAPDAQAGPQQAPAEEQVEDTGEDIVVTGQLRGAVPGDIPPETQLSPAEIRSYGASNMSELLGQLATQLGSGQGRGDEQPVILLAGRRSNRGEIATLPTEAIERIDILPEEVALKYGYSANQKVINVVLRRRFLALTTEAEGRMPTAGGNAGGKANANLTMIRRTGRLELDALYDQSSGILESERGVSRAGSSFFDTRGNIVAAGDNGIDPAFGTDIGVVGVPEAAAGGAQPLSAFLPRANDPNVTDLRPYRTLVNPQKNLNLKGVYRPTLPSGLDLTARVELQGSESSALLGLPGVTLGLPTGNPFSPFAEDVQVLRYLDSQPPLTRASSTRRLESGVTVNGDGMPWSKSWRWSAQGNYTLSTSQSTTDSGVDPIAMQALLDAGDPGFNPFAPIAAGLIRSRPLDTATSRDSTGRIDLLTNGPLFQLPAGNATAAIRVAGETRDFSSESFRRGIRGAADLGRDTASIRGNIDLPIASRRMAVLDALGDLTLNANFEVEQLSDFGRLTSTGYGINWRPIPAVRAQLSWSQDSRAPDPGQLGNPVLVTPNVRVFDYVRGESVDVTAIGGGNPGLLADSRHVFKAGLRIRPFTETNLDIMADYTSQNFRNTFGAFPGATAEVEAAFPERFVRDTDGRLLSIDTRPINFARQERSQLKWGFNLFVPIASPAQKRMQERRTAFQAAMAESRRTGQPLPPEFSAQLEQFRRLGQQQSLFGGNQRGRGQGQARGEGQTAAPAGQGANPPQGQPATPGEGETRGPGGGRFGPGGGGGGGRGFGGRGGFGGNVIRLSAFHTWVFKDERLIRPGLPVLDYLNGAARSSLSGGTPAHQIEVQSAIQRDGLRLQLNASWESGSEVAAGTLGSGDRLNFGSLAKLGLIAQADLGQQLDLMLKHPWLRGTRVTFGVDNLFDARRRVTDESGDVPSAYDPNLLDPTGRTVRLSIRKQFF